jgi:hypothetical protein
MTETKPRSIFWPQLTIGILFILIFGGSLYVVFVMQVLLDDVLERIAFILIGVLSTNVTTIINYFFGSSAGSKTKDMKIEN